MRGQEGMVGRELAQIACCRLDGVRHRCNEGHAGAVGDGTYCVQLLAFADD